MEDIPDQAFVAYLRQRRNALKRGIDFNFTFEDWWSWWKTDDRWSRRGRGRDKLVMARKGDIGPYDPANVYCATHAQNLADISPERRAQAARKAWANRERKPSHLKVRGEGHPRSRAVITPEGEFGSASLAADHFGISRVAAAYRANNEIKGWRWRHLAETVYDAAKEDYQSIRGRLANETPDRPK